MAPGSSGAGGGTASSPSSSSAAGKGPEYLFSCPPGFFNSATLYRGVLGAYTSPESKAEEVEPVAIDSKSHNLETEATDGRLATVLEGESSETGPADLQEESGRWTCISCRAAFTTAEEQRSHFKLDYHRLNVKRRVVGKIPISEEEFENLAEGRGTGVDDDLSSISGSDDEKDSSDQARVLRRSNRIYLVVPGWDGVLSLWRTVFVAEKEYLQGERGSTDSEDAGGLSVSENELLSRLKHMVSNGPDADNNSSYQVRTWIVVLMAGGHFAGLVSKMAGGDILDHHTFHRYVVRAKAGGRQSGQDKTGRAPKSAGSSLRRHNEAALQKEVRELLNSWADHLRSASRIFVYAPSANAPALFGGENAPLSRNDPRIRRIPFTTRRPTYKEAKRVHHILAGISYEQEPMLLSETANKTMDGRKDGATKGVKSDVQAAATATKSGLQLSSVDRPVGDRADQLDSSLEDTGEKESNTRDTHLHNAAKSGDTDLVQRLLEDGLDPCVKDDGGYTPYARSKDKETRNVFRRFMAKHLELWDWQAANVPSALTEEMETTQAAKQADKDAKRKEREKERRKQKKEQTKAKEAEKKSADLAALAISNVRGTAAPKPLSKDNPKAQSAGYQEALLKAQSEERERRAAAAELRMRALIAGKEAQTSNSESKSSSSVSHTNTCSCCGDSLTGKTPFHRYSYQYCSTTCVQVHKKYLDSE